MLLTTLVAVLSLSNNVMLILNADSNGPKFRRLWGTQVKPCDDGEPNFVTSSNRLLRHLPVPPTFAHNQDTTLLFTDRVSRVRLLGGWKGGPGPESGDFVTVAADGTTFTADWYVATIRLRTRATPAFQTYQTALFLHRRRILSRRCCFLFIVL